MTMASLFRPALAGLLALTLSATAAAASRVAQGIEVDLSLSKTDILAGEPLNLVVRVTNRSQPLRIASFSTKLYLTENNDLRVMVQAPGELPARFEGNDRQVLYPAVEVDLKIGDSWYQSVPLVYDRNADNGYRFGKPGRYVVSAKLICTVLRDPQAVEVELPPTAVNVREPEGRAAGAWRLLADKTVARSFQVGMPEDQDAAGRLARVADEFADTPYGPDAMYLAGTWETRSGGDLDRAVATFRKFIERFPTHPRRSDALFNIVLAFHTQKRFGVARDWFFYLMDTDPAYELIRKENSTASFYYFRFLEQLAQRRWWMYDRPWDTTGMKTDEQKQAAKQGAEEQ